MSVCAPDYEETGEVSRWVRFLEQDPHIKRIDTTERRYDLPGDEAYTYAGFLYPEEDALTDDIRLQLRAIMGSKDQSGIEKLLHHMRERTINEIHLDDLARIHDALESFLLRDPIIEDDFDNRHDEPGGRRQWEAAQYAIMKHREGEAAARELSRFLGSNRLNRNRMSGMVMMLEELESIAKSTNHPEIAAIIYQCRMKGVDLLKGVRPYQEKTLLEKHAVLREFDALIIQVLHLFTNHGATSFAASESQAA